MTEKSMFPNFPGKTKKEKVEHRFSLEAEEIVSRLMNENAFQRTQIRAAIVELSKNNHQCEGLTLIGGIRTVLQKLENALKAKYDARDALKKLRAHAASSKNVEFCDEIDKVLECLK